MQNSVNLNDMKRNNIRSQFMKSFISLHFLFLFEYVVASICVAQKYHDDGLLRHFTPLCSLKPIYLLF